MLKVTVIQGQLPEYRIPIFNELARHVDLSVIHSGSKKNACSFQQIVVSKLTIGPFVLQRGLYKHLKSAEVVIAMFDIRWLSILFAQFKFQTKGKAWIYWGHGIGQSKVLSSLRLKLAKKANALVLYSFGRIAPFVNNGVITEKIFEAPNTLVVSNSSYESNSAREDFLFVGSLYKEKLVDELIKAFSIFAANYEVGKLHVVGKGECLEELKDLANDLEISKRINFHGQILDDIKLKTLFDVSLAYVSPGVVGLGVLHSFAYGVPVITKRGLNHGPEYDNLKEDNSFVYEGGTENLADILVKVKTDKELYLKRKAAYVHYSEKRMPKHMVSGFLKAIEYVNDKENK